MGSAVLIGIHARVIRHKFDYILSREMIAALQRRREPIRDQLLECSSVNMLVVAEAAYARFKAMA